MRNSGKTLCQNLLLHSWGQYTKSEHGKHVQEHLYTSKTEVILKKNDFSAVCLYIQLRGYIEMCWDFQIMPTRVSADDEISHLTFRSHKEERLNSVWFHLAMMYLSVASSGTKPKKYWPDTKAL